MSVEASIPVREAEGGRLTGDFESVSLISLVVGTGKGAWLMCRSAILGSGGKTVEATRRSRAEEGSREFPLIIGTGHRRIGGGVRAATLSPMVTRWYSSANSEIYTVGSKIKFRDNVNG